MPYFVIVVGEGWACRRRCQGHSPLRRPPEVCLCHPVARRLPILVRVFQPAMASNALFGVLLGGLITAVVGALVSWLLLVVAYAIGPHAVNYFGQSSQEGIDFALGIYPLHSPWRDSLQLFLVMHGVPFQEQFQSGDSGLTVSHAYQSNGTFTVTVTVVDPPGHSSSVTTQVTVLPPVPQASFTYAVGYYGYVGFDASNSSADPSTYIASYNWDFGDGYTDQTGGPQDYHYYSYYGTYQVTLIVVDGTGQQSSPYQLEVTI